MYDYAIKVLEKELNALIKRISELDNPKASHHYPRLMRNRLVDRRTDIDSALYTLRNEITDLDL